MSKKQRLQDAHSGKILNYGHLGPLNYNQETEEWETSRVIQPDDSSLETPHYTTASSAFPFRHVSTSLLRPGDLSEPARREQGGGVGHHRDDDRQTFPLDYGGQPTPEELLAVGGALVTDDQFTGQSAPTDRSITAIGAAVGGSTGNVVRIFTLNHFVQEAEAGVNSSSHDASSGDQRLNTEWKSPGGPIQQIYFATTTGYHSTWMAVRLHTSTVIFHPLISRKIHANPVISLPISRTGGFSHADVAILSTDDIKVALVDTRGNWSIWQMEGADSDRLDVKNIVSLILHGRLTPPAPEKFSVSSYPGEWHGKSSVPSYSDKWHQIEWFVGSKGQTGFLFVCSRYNASFFASSGAWQKSVNLRLERSVQGRIVLEVQKSQTRPDLVFILTSVALLAVSLKAGDETGDGHQAHEHVLLGWRHFRSQRDTTLRLNLAESSLGLTALVTSMTSNVILAFRFEDHPSLTGLIVSKSDPCCFQLPQYSQLGLWPRVSCFHTAGRSQLHGATGTPPDSEVDWTLLALNKDGSVIEYGYKRLENGNAPSLVRVPPLVMLHRSERSTRDSRTAQRQLEERVTSKHSTRDWQDVYDVLITGKDGFGTVSRSVFNDLLGDQEDQLRNRGASRFSSLLEKSSSRLLITDVDEDSKELEMLLASMLSDRTRTMHLSRSPRLRLPTITLTQVYESIMAVHFRPLPSQMPDRIRIYRERVIRRVAADLYLASWAVCPVLSTIAIAAQEETQPDSGPADMSVLPTSPPSSFPILPSSQPPALDEDPVFSCLKRYAGLSQPSSTTASHISHIPELQSILRHLPESADSNPADYSWRSVEDTLAEETEDRLALDLAERDPREAKRLERAKVARQKREAARLEQSQAMAQRNRPPRVLSSQAPNYEAAMPDRSLSSQIGPAGQGRWSSQMESSQPEPSTMLLSQSSGIGLSQGGQSQAGGGGVSKAKSKAKKRTAGF